MAYCRFSSDGFRSCVYAYQAESGYIIHVAARRRLVPGHINCPLTDAVDMIAKGGPSVQDQALLQYRKQMSEIENSGWEDLTCPSAGKTLFAADIFGFRDNLAALAREGVPFPYDSVLRTIDDEIAEIVGLHDAQANEPFNDPSPPG